MVENPWPDFAKGNRRTIKTILTEMGSGISEKTGDAIKFQVQTIPDGKGVFKHNCSLYIPSMYYQYPFMTVTHPISMFPVTTQSDVFGQPVVSKTETEFTDILKQIFSSDSTKTVVEQLLDAAN